MEQVSSLKSIKKGWKLCPKIENDKLMKMINMSFNK